MHFLKQGGRNKEKIQRAIREKMAYNQSLVFLELPKISPKALQAIFHSFENGVDDLYVDVRGTTVKLPSYNRDVIFQSEVQFLSKLSTVMEFIKITKRTPRQFFKR